ncbi:hypothetical protein F511_12930 [Dorcoceras hygrometricum]|uniref:Uncharacterized protein n=1 Tax=Dorcoceras hygrometricum TaxID=472368 RepID=A0A2Z7B9K8_9LAMI|nr:hypothetical protein F511_12930 [Dorcoceras hygrometricum]
MGFLYNMVPDRDVSQLRGTTNFETVGLFEAQLTAAMAWGGEVIKLLSQAQREVNSTRQSFDEVMEHHTELEMQLEELEATRGQENRAAEAQKEALEALLAAEKAARAAEKEASAAKKRALEAELETTYAERAALKVELSGTKGRAEDDIGRLRSEAENAWGLGKEEFLKSFEFDDLCTKKSLAYFKNGFEGCVAQFKANGYSEEEHPAPFLSVARALEELPEEDEEEIGEEDEEDASGDEANTPLKSPKQ